jgi:peptide-methionine (S)-S-oxide reductase
MLRVLLLAAVLIAMPAFAEETARALPKPVEDVQANGTSQTAILAGGCFWGMQGVFQHVKGVQRVIAGYSGGAARSAQYETVGRGNTGHAESVQIVFDPSVISYGRLLQVFFSVMDPTELDFQGPDYGPQYRSEIFAVDAAQRHAAMSYIAQLNGAHAFSAPIVTRISDLHGFYRAEAYHQDYLIHHPDQPYIVVNDLPKIEKLRQLYPDLYQARAITVAAR